MDLLKAEQDVLAGEPGTAGHERGKAFLAAGGMRNIATAIRDQADANIRLSRRLLVLNVLVTLAALVTAASAAWQAFS